MATLKNTTINDTAFLRLPAGTTAQRPSSPIIGMSRYNTTLNVLEHYTNAGWIPLYESSIVASGGNNTTDINVNGVSYRVHQFTTVGTSNFVISSGYGPVEFLIIGGGGAGSKAHGTNTIGGGGAGGYRCSVPGEQSGGGCPAETPVYLGPGTYPVVVGAGGTCPTASGNQTGTNGGNSSAFGIVSFGGGHGGDERGISGYGGSGGGGPSYGNYPNLGAATRAYLGSPGVPCQGFKGGDSDGRAGIAASGGGGAGGPGIGGAQNNSDIGAAGGPGVSSSITGTPIFRGGGGGSANWQDSASGGAGGIGGGGNGGTNVVNATNGAANTGGGGGGSKSATLGGNGGSGIVILRYRIG